MVLYTLSRKTRGCLVTVHRHRYKGFGQSHVAVRSASVSLYIDVFFKPSTSAQGVVFPSLSALSVVSLYTGRLSGPGPALHRAPAGPQINPSFMQSCFLRTLICFHLSFCLMTIAVERTGLRVVGAASAAQGEKEVNVQSKNKHTHGLCVSGYDPIVVGWPLMNLRVATINIREYKTSEHIHCL